MLLIIAHNNGDCRPPEEALKYFPSGTIFCHFSSHSGIDGYRFFAQVDIEGFRTRNLANDAEFKEQIRWVEFKNFKIGG